MGLDEGLACGEYRPFRQDTGVAETHWAAQHRFVRTREKLGRHRLGSKTSAISTSFRRSLPDGFPQQVGAFCSAH